MRGTEKQVKWAESIKEALAEKFEELEKKMGPAPEVVRQYIQDELAHDEAKYFIDTWRYITKDNLLDILVRERNVEVAEAAVDWEIEYDLNR